MSESKLGWPAIVLFAYVVVALIQPLLLPPIGIPSLDNFLLPFAGLLLLKEYWTDDFFKRGVFIFGFAIVIAFTSNFLNGGLVLSEILWGMRWAKLFVLLWSGYYLIRKHPDLFQWMIQSLFLLMVLVNALQLMKVEPIIAQYAHSSRLAEYAKSTIQESRIFGTMQNANNNALVMALFAVYFFFSNIRWKYIMMTLAIGIVLMTQSRTGIVAVGGTVFLSILFQNMHFDMRRIALIGGGALVAVFAMWLLDLHYLSSLFDGTAFQSSSLLTRFDVLGIVMDMNADSWLLGHGKVASIPDLIGHSIDNEFAYLYLEYGVLGLTSMVAVLIYLILVAKNKNANSSWWALLLIMLICGLTNLAFTNPECGVLFFVLFLSGLKEEKRIAHEQR